MLVKPHDVYVALDKQPMFREYLYRELFKVSLSDQDVHEIRESLSANDVLCESRFREDIENTLAVSLDKGIRVGLKTRPDHKTIDSTPLDSRKRLNKYQSRS